MINPKSFIEFYKNEFNVNFVDIKTGKNKNCLSCRWAAHGDGILLHEEDTICINDKSEYVTEWVSEDMVCNLWDKVGETGE